MGAHSHPTLTQPRKMQNWKHCFFLQRQRAIQSSWSAMCQITFVISIPVGPECIFRPSHLWLLPSGANKSHILPQREFDSYPCRTGGRWQRIHQLLTSIKLEKASSRGEAGKWNPLAFPCPSSCCFVSVCKWLFLSFGYSGNVSSVRIRMR